MAKQARWPWEAQGVAVAREKAKAEAAHRRERRWQILAPMVVGGLVVLAVAIWVATQAQGTTVSQAAGAVVIYASLVCLFGGLPLLAVLIGLIVVVVKAQQRTPEVTQQMLNGLVNLRRALLVWTDKTASPFIRWRSRAAAWKALAQALLRGGKSDDKR